MWCSRWGSAAGVDSHVSHQITTQDSTEGRRSKKRRGWGSAGGVGSDVSHQITGQQRGERVKEHRGWGSAGGVDSDVSHQITTQDSTEGRGARSAGGGGPLGE